MSINAASQSGMLSPEFAAYTKLTLVNRVQREVNGYGYDAKKSISFEQFLQAMANGKVVNKSYSRNISADEVRNNAIHSQNSDESFAQQRFSFIEKAYELGLADANGILISAFETTA